MLYLGNIYSITTLLINILFRKKLNFILLYSTSFKVNLYSTILLYNNSFRQLPPSFVFLLAFHFSVYSSFSYHAGLEKYRTHKNL